MSKSSTDEKVVEKATASKEDENQKVASKSEQKAEEKTATKVEEKSTKKAEEKTATKAEEKSAKKDSKNLLESVKKFVNENKKIVMIAGIAILAIIVLLIAVNAFKSFGGNKNREYPLVYLTKDGDMKFISSKKKSGTEVDGKGEDVDNIIWSNSSDKYLMYIKNDDLYLYNTKNKKDSDKIASDVKKAIFTEDDKYIIFVDDDNNLYSYNYKDKSKLDSDVTNIEGATKSSVFYEKDDNLYVRSVKASKDDKKKIVSDYSSAILNENKTKILIKTKNEEEDDSYSYNYDYSVYNIKTGKTEKVVEGASGVYYNEDFTEFYYYVKGGDSKVKLADYVDDDKLEDDEKFVAYTYDDYREGKVTYDEYYDSLDEKYAVEKRNDIRKKIQDKEYSSSAGSDLYYVKGKKDTKIDSNVDEVLDVDFDSKTVAYTKNSSKSNKKIKMSEVKYYSDITDFIDDNKEATVEINVNLKNNYTLDIDSDKEADVYLIGKDIYYVLDKELYHTKTNGKKLTEAKSLGDKVSVIDATGDYKDGILFLEDSKSYVGDLRFAKGTKVTKVDDDVYKSSVTISDSGKLFYLGDYDTSDTYGELRSYNGKAKKIADEVAQFIHVKDNYIYVFKDYSSKSGTYDLYTYKGSKKLKLVDYSVDDVYYNSKK